MLNLSKTVKFVLAVSAQVLVIAAIVIYKMALLSGGTDILLQLQPVDPRDFLRGDYVTVSYNISNVNYYDNSRQLYNPIPNNSSMTLPVKAPSGSIQNGDTVYVGLYKSGKFWQTNGSVSKTKPRQNADSSDCDSLNGCVSYHSGLMDIVYIQGTVVSGGGGDASNYGSRNLHIAYGIEDYFVPEGKGSSLSLRNTSQNNYARVAVNADGTAILKQLYIDDKPWP